MSGTNYVLGFLFNKEGDVALIRKTHPPWQAGKWNGIGGKIDGDEDPETAMVREFRKETGQEVGNWRHVARLIDVRGYLVHVFAAWGEPTQYPDSFPTGDNDTEIVRVYDKDSLASAALPNVRWLVPMAWSMLCGDESRALRFDIVEFG